jgi:hypothetical protein
VVLAGYALEFSGDEQRILGEYISDGGILISTPRTAMRTAGGGMSQFPLSILSDADFHVLDFGALGPEEQVTVEGEAGQINGCLWIEDLQCVSGKYVELGKLRDRFYLGKAGIFKYSTRLGGAHFHFAVIPRIDESFQDWFLQNVPCDMMRFRIKPFTDGHILPVSEDRVLVLNYGEFEQRVSLHEERDFKVIWLMRGGEVLKEPGPEARNRTSFLDIEGRSAAIVIV